MKQVDSQFFKDTMLKQQTQALFVAEPEDNSDCTFVAHANSTRSRKQHHELHGPLGRLAFSFGARGLSRGDCFCWGLCSG
jgi:hypothetical protein